MIGESTSVSKSAARKLCGRPSGAAGRAVTVSLHPAAGSTRTSWGRGADPARVRNVGAPFSIAKSASTQFVRTLISRQ